jgi:protein sidekick
LQFEDISDRAVRVVWSKPLNINGILTGYTLTYTIRDRPDTFKTENLTATTTSIMVAQLQVRMKDLVWQPL